MSEIVISDAAKVPAVFKPGEAKIHDAKADAVIEYAKKVRDWPLLLKTIDEKIDELDELIQWWGDSVRNPGNQPNNAEPHYLSMEQAEKFTGFMQPQISRIGTRLKNRETFRSALYGLTYRKAMAEKTDQRGASGTGENEWYTPAEYLEAARDVLGGIDLDPASSDKAQEHVSADCYFTKTNSGLDQSWYGRVWLNPPYAQPLIAEFVSKMVREIGIGRVKAAIMLTHNYTDTAWFHEAAHACAAVCFTRGRVKFFNAKGAIAAPTQGQAFFYFGDDIAGFAARFASIGFVVVPYGEADAA